MIENVNVYCTVTNLSELNFRYQLNSKRDLEDLALTQHLNDFIGFVTARGQRQMTATLYGVIQHILNVKHQVSCNVAEEDLNDLFAWAKKSNGILFFPDASIRDASGRVLVDPQTGLSEEQAVLPYPEDALVRKQTNIDFLKSRNVAILDSLPPVLDSSEVIFRDVPDVADRMIALLAVAIRAESLSSGDPLPVEEINEKLSLSFADYSGTEKAFLTSAQPEQQEIVNHAWRYESVYLLEWVMGLVEELPYPETICDVPLTAKTILDIGRNEIAEKSKLRSSKEILDSLDLHYRLHWATTDARVNNGPTPPGVDKGVVMERYKTLNWLVDPKTEWDEIDTPT